MLFQIKVRNPSENRISIYTDIALKRGQGVEHDAADATPLNNPNGMKKAKLGSNVAVVGLACRHVNATGVTLEDSLDPWPAGTNQSRGAAEPADKFPVMIGLEPLPLEMELEAPLAGNAAYPGDYLVTSGTGAIDDTTAVGSALAYNGGKLRVAQATDTPMYTLKAQLAAESGAGGAAGWCRISVAKVGR